MCEADPRCVVKAEAGQERIAVKGVPHPRHAFLTADVVEQPHDVSGVGLEVGVAFGDTAGGERDVSRVREPRPPGFFA